MATTAVISRFISNQIAHADNDEILKYHFRMHVDNNGIETIINMKSMNHKRCTFELYQVKNNKKINLIFKSIGAFCLTQLTNAISEYLEKNCDTLALQNARLSKYINKNLT